MSFNNKEKENVISKLISRGWHLKDDTIFAPSGDIWFSGCHFEDWSPLEMLETIESRGKRVERERHDGWKLYSNEHNQLCEAIRSMLNEK